MISLVIPNFGGHPENLARTIDSCRHLCDDVVVVSTALHVVDLNNQKRLADTVIELPWNSVFRHGFSHVHNAGTAACKNDWILLLGTAETFKNSWADIPTILLNSSSNRMFRCDHENDTNLWKRIWNRQGGVQWSGLIHEELTGGETGEVLFRFQDTPKTPCDSPLQQEVLRWLKVCSYNVQYHRLLNDNTLLGATDPGWLKFVNGSAEAIRAFWNDHQDLIQPCLSGYLPDFLKAVDKRMDKGEQAEGINFAPTGEPMTA